MSSEQDSPKPTRKMREMERNRRDILAAAIALFAERGFYQTTMQDIADAAEFSVGYLYKHFPGKEDMYREMLGYHIEQLDALMAKVEARRLPPLDEIRENYLMACGHFNQHPDFMRIYHGELGIEFSEADQFKRQHYESLKDCLDRAVAGGDLKPVDTVLLALAIQGASKELFHELATRPGENRFDPIPDLLFELIIDHLRPGFLGS